jgi:hypothetical protein
VSRFLAGGAAPSHHHLGITVDSLEQPYRVAERRGALDREAFGNHLLELPGDIDRLSPQLRGELKGLWDFHPQSEQNLQGRLFVPAHALDRSSSPPGGLGG